MIAKFLKIRILQARRELHSVGLFYAVSLLLVFGLVCYKSYVRGIGWPEDRTYVGILLFIIGSIHWARPDKRFVSLIAGDNAWKIYFSEYVLASLPLVSSVLHSSQWYWVVVFWLLIGILCWQPLNLAMPKFIWPQVLLLNSVIPIDNFEWRSGMRRVQYIFIFLYLGVLALAWIDLSGFLLTSLLVFCLYTCYDNCESMQMLRLYDSDAQSFIWQKIKNHTLLLIQFLLPVLLLYGFKYPSKAWIFLLLTIVYIINFQVFILNKYKSFSPNRPVASQATIVGLLLIGLLIPYMFPIALVLWGVFYVKAVRRMAFYL
jgi:hypothetical protein